MTKATLIMKRIEALVTQARINAKNHGGDDANALMELTCACILLSRRKGLDPDLVAFTHWDHALAAVAGFWPDEQVEVNK